MNYFNYFTEIEDTFIRRRGKSLFLSPLDWALIETWKEIGIPLHIVIRSIESVFDVFDRQPPGTRSIKSLFYCREEVEVQYAEWLRSQTGKAADDAGEAPGFSADSVAAHIQNAIDAFRSNTRPELTADLSRASARLEDAAKQLGGDPETIDATLNDIEKIVDRAMLTNWDKQHLKQIEKEVAAQLREYKAEMSAEAYENTFNLMLLKRLREEAGIPRLGLYYI